MQFLEENEETVIGLREGSLLQIQERTVVLKGPNAARIFRHGEKPFEAAPDSNLFPLLESTVPPVGRVP